MSYFKCSKMSFSSTIETCAPVGFYVLWYVLIHDQEVIGVIKRYPLGRGRNPTEDLIPTWKDRSYQTLRKNQSFQKVWSVRTYTGDLPLS